MGGWNTPPNLKQNSFIMTLDYAINPRWFGNQEPKCYIIVAHFYDYTYCFKSIEMETLDTLKECEDYLKGLDKEDVYEMMSEAIYTEDENDEQSISDVNFEIFGNEFKEGKECIHTLVATTKGIRYLFPNE